MFITTNTSKLKCLFQLISKYGKKFSICIIALVLCFSSIMPVFASDGTWWTDDYPIEEYPPIETDLGLPFVLMNYNYQGWGESVVEDGGTFTDDEVFLGVDYNWYGKDYSFDFQIQSYDEAEDFTISMSFESDWFPLDSGVSHVSNMYVYIEDSETGRVVTIPLSDLKEDSRVWSFTTTIERDVTTTLDIIVYIFIEYPNNQYHNFAVTNLTLDSIVPEVSAEEYLAHGYEGTGVSDASDRFNDAFSDYQEQEQALMGDAQQYANDYAADAFNTNLLDELGETVTFVVTWFTNFWNLGGTFTAVLSMLFAISIVMYILRIK